MDPRNGARMLLVETKLKGEFESMQSHRHLIDENWCSDHANPANLSDRGGPYLDVERKSQAMVDCIGSKAFELGSGIFRVLCKSKVARDRDSSFKAEYVEHPAGPDQRIIAKIAFPKPGMMQSERSDPVGINRLGHCAVQNMPEFKVTALIADWPSVSQLMSSNQFHR